MGENIYQEILIETFNSRKLNDKDLSQRRLYFCFMYLKKLMGEDTEAVEAFYKETLLNVDCYQDFYLLFFDNPTIDSEKEMITAWEHVYQSDDTASKEVLKKIHGKIKDVIRKEKDFEKNLNEILENIKKEHPIIYKFIVIFFTAIVLGMIEDFLYDSVHNDTNFNQPTAVYYHLEENYDCEINITDAVNIVSINNVPIPNEDADCEEIIDKEMIYD